MKIIDDEVRCERLQFDINMEAIKILALLSGKIDKYKCLTGVLPSNQSRIIEEAKLTYSPLGKVFEKKKKNNWRSRIKIKQIKALKALKPKIKS